MDMPMKKKRTATARAAARIARRKMDHLVKGPMTPSKVQDLMLAFKQGGDRTSER